MPRPKGSPNKLTAEIKQKLSEVIMNAMSSIDIELMTQNEKLKLIQIGLTYVIPKLKQVENIEEEEPINYDFFLVKKSFQSSQPKHNHQKEMLH